MKGKRSNEKLKDGGLRDAARRLKKKNATDVVLWQSAQRGAKDARKMRYRSFVDAVAEEGTRTKKG